MNDLASAFNTLKKKLPDYENRPQQIEMAEEVFVCLRNKNRLLIEAGTGVGKSFAYLIPAILSNEKTIVSTASIALQDQLVNKDLLFLQKTLSRKFSFAILKGKNNYLCLKREREFAEFGESYKRFIEWASVTETGDKDELHFIPDFWPRVCGDSDDCSVGVCPFYSDCFYYRHYKTLHEKDILVVNHHILIYDLLSDFNLLPFHTQLIIDEAHQIENVISHAAGSTLDYSRVMWLLYRLKGLKIAVDNLFEPVDSFFKRKDIPLRAANPIPEGIVEGLRNLRELLALDKVVQRLNADKESFSGDELKDRVETTINSLRSLDSVIDDFIEQGDKEKVYYMTGNKKSMELKSSLVESQGPFGVLANGYDSLVMTSATLTAGGNFRFLNERLGMNRTVHTYGITCPQSESGTGFKEVVVGSPFNYKRQAVLYIDKGLPSPVKKNHDMFIQKSVEVIEGLINASMGRSLVLFTSYSHLRFVSENIRIEYPFKSQGDMPPARLIRWFKKTSNPVLLATATFWQGIDIKGEKLSMVIVVKMPFGSPGDPVYDERCRRLGDQWFTGLALPSAILQMRQGFGRLIRGADDYGVIAMLDSRLINSSYGGSIISSLPDMDIVHRIGDVQKFFDKTQADAGSQGRVNSNKFSVQHGE